MFTYVGPISSVHESILETIGSPLVAVDAPADARIAAKLESYNPGGSAKDRPALAMVEAAEEAGALDETTTIVEPTSGNTGIGLAMVGAVKGYAVRVVMPASKSAERRELLRAYGATVELVDGDVSAARARADELAEQPEYVQLRQFENSANPQAHYRTTAEELLEQTEDAIDAFVAGVGTGGTLSGAGRRLSEAFPEMEIVAVEPTENAVLTGEPAGNDGYQGMGPGFVSENTDTELIDAVETVSLSTAEQECRRLARNEGILAGQSSGASMVAARRVATRLATTATAPLVVTVFWDSGERYLSAGTFDT
ncbi:MAG: cysteine synthase [halophilic archaeon J07HX5]|nr:MAG: cysteine synthase [halophilic archaeon J07HX5]